MPKGMFEKFQVKRTATMIGSLGQGRSLTASERHSLSEPVVSGQFIGQ